MGFNHYKATIYEEHRDVPLDDDKLTCIEEGMIGYPDHHLNSYHPMAPPYSTFDDFEEDNGLIYIKNDTEGYPKCPLTSIWAFLTIYDNFKTEAMESTTHYMSPNHIPHPLPGPNNAILAICASAHTPYPPPWPIQTNPSTTFTSPTATLHPPPWPNEHTRSSPTLSTPPPSTWSCPLATTLAK